MEAIEADTDSANAGVGRGARGFTSGGDEGECGDVDGTGVGAGAGASTGAGAVTVASRGAGSDAGASWETGGRRGHLHMARH